MSNLYMKHCSQRMAVFLSVGAVIGCSSWGCDRKATGSQGVNAHGESSVQSKAAVPNAAAAPAVSSSASALARVTDPGTPPLLRDAGGPPVYMAHKIARPIVPTGEFDVKIWGGANKITVLFDEKGEGLVPANEVRFLWGESALYMWFYGGDFDLQAHAKKHDDAVWKDDSVGLTFFSETGEKLIIHASPAKQSADGRCPKDARGLDDPRCDLKWESGIRFGTDVDGTFNKIGDRDEEWAVEAVIPFKAIGVKDPKPGTRIDMILSRCEIAHDGPRGCGSWGRHGEPGVLILE